MRAIWRYLWPAPWTALGALAAGLIRLGGGRVCMHHGVLECHGRAVAAVCRRLPRAMRFDAITLGHVVLARDGACMDIHRAHERVHVRQYERWGAAFIPAYLLAGLWQWCRGADPYLDNPFEREAYAVTSVSISPAAGAVVAKME